MTLYGYIRTSHQLQKGVAVMDPFSQEIKFPGVSSGEGRGRRNYGS